MAEKAVTFHEKLTAIQTEIKAPKNLYNSFGKYSYRNAEGICEAVKPFLKKYSLSLTLSDEIVNIGDKNYVKSTATISDGTDDKTVVAYAREADEKKGMDDSQITGATSSYARKYALNGMFLLDDTKDANTDEYHSQAESAKQRALKQEAPERAIQQDPMNEQASDVERVTIRNLLEEKGYSVEEIFPQWPSFTKGNYIEAVEKIKKFPVRAKK